MGMINQDLRHLRIFPDTQILRQKLRCIQKFGIRRRPGIYRKILIQKIIIVRKLLQQIG